MSVNLSEAGQNAEFPQVAIDLQSDALAVWQRFDGSNFIAQAAFRPAGGSWQVPVDLSEAGGNAEFPQVAFDRQGDALAVWQRSTSGGNFEVQAASRPAGGSWQAPVNLSQVGGSAEAPQVSFDSQGDALAVWQRSNGSNVMVQAAWRPAGGSWQAPVDLSQVGGSAEAPQVSFDSQGDALAVWQRSDGSDFVVQAAWRPAGGSWQAPVTVSDEASQGAALPQVALDSQGDATVVWELASAGNFVVQAAWRPVGGSWQAPANLSEAGSSATLPRLACDPEGDAAVVWESAGGGHVIVQAAFRPAGGSWQAPADLTEAGPGKNATVPQIAFDPQGDAMAVWERANGGEGTIVVQAASRPAGGSWQAPVTLSESGQNGEFPQVVFDPRGNAVVVWERTDGSDLIVQAADYDAVGPLLNGPLISTSGTTTTTTTTGKSGPPPPLSKQTRSHPRRRRSHRRKQGSHRSKRSSRRSHRSK